jgi:tRNA modification GTPase
VRGSEFLNPIVLHSNRVSEFLTPVIDLEDTIVAVATPRGGAVRGVVRLSGPRSWPIVASSFQPELPAPTDPFHPAALDGQIQLAPQLSLTSQQSPHTRLPATLFLNRSPRSYTGQDQAEVHTIGSPPILQQLLASFLAAGARQALPGEFTMRAFLNGKLDLTAAEAVAGLIDATSTRQADAALAQLAGGIAGPINRLRDTLLDLLAELEAGLDFAEEDIEFIDRATLRDSLHRACDELRDLERQMDARSLAVDRRRVVLLGPPNAGKSSLFNALVGRDAAIVSETSGTTRDYLVAELRLPSGSVELIDTAGFDAARHAIASLAQSSREHAARQAELILWCVDASASAESADATLAMPPDDLLELDQPVLLVGTKHDIADPAFALPFTNVPATMNSARVVASVSVSSRTGAGLDHLCRLVESWSAGSDQSDSHIVASTATRCRQSIAGALDATRRAGSAVQSNAGDDVIALELRVALDELAHVVGAVYTDDILDRIFSRFCIGK